MTPKKGRLTGFTLEIDAPDEDVLNRLLDAVWCEAERLRDESHRRRLREDWGFAEFASYLHRPLPFVGRVVFRSEIV